MKGSVWRALGVSVVPALVVAGTALAANSASYVDRIGDAAPAPDIATLTLSSDDAGLVTIRVGLANRDTLVEDDEVQIGLDVDQNPDTGSMFYGAEYGIDLSGSEVEFLRAGSSRFLEPTAAPASLRVDAAAGVVSFTFSGSEVGLAATSGFEIWAYSFAKGYVDTEPDFRTINYQLIPGNVQPTLGVDRRAPVVQAHTSRGTHGKNVELLYEVREGRGKSADTVRIFKGKRLVKTLRYRLEDTSPFLYYWGNWKAPKKVRGAYRFCVSAVDEAGNKSNTSCAKLTIR
jgi:hypothetical protein